MQATINLSVPTTIAAFDDGPECHSGVDGIRREIGWALGRFAKVAGGHTKWGDGAQPLLAVSWWGEPSTE